jgi:ergothioneine biosynthesis protein EgtB
MRTLPEDDNMDHSPKQSRLMDRYRSVRSQTLVLAEPLSVEDSCAQSMPDASPVKWHLGHTTWFFETFILETHEKDFQPFHAAFRMLFNSYYNGIGEKHPRAQRGLLTRPSLAEVLLWRANVDERMLALLEADQAGALANLTHIGLQHEQQHQELIRTDVKHLLSMNPLQPAYLPQAAETPKALPALEWLPFAGGVVGIGHTGEGFCFDNELPRHRQFLESFELASRLVTNAEYADFIAAGGYQNAALWLSEGWDWVRQNQLQHPLYWRRHGDGWQEFTDAGLAALAPHHAVNHISYFEADAYARWADARLPTEAEWEHAAATDAVLPQMFGLAWQWTASSYAAYPGFAPAPGALGEYNGKFMINQYVLRGSSQFTPIGHARASYRNFFPATARWQCSGIRLART